METMFVLTITPAVLTSLELFSELDLLSRMEGTSKGNFPSLGTKHLLLDILGLDSRTCRPEVFSLFLKRNNLSLVPPIVVSVF